MPAPAIDVFKSLDQALASAVATAAPAVVSVRRRHSGGSGIAWAQDLVISASYHTPDRTQIGVAKDPEAELECLDAEVIGRDPATDVALLRVASASLTPATLRDLGDLAVGNLALAVGRPGRSARASLRAIGVLGTDVKTGWGQKLEHYIESDRQIPRGFAGGPLIDADGAVIGMNTRTLMRGTDLAIGTATLRRVVAELQAHGGIRRGYLGVGAYPAQLPTTVATTLGRNRGALIASIDESSPAATGGLLVGDLVIELGGTPVTGPDSLRAALSPLAGQSITVVVLRGGARQELTVTIGQKT